MAQAPTIDRLLYSVADSPDSVLQQLRQHPELASEQDHHGYSLIHAAASYGHVDLLRALVQELKVDINIKDEDGETALFNVETTDMAAELIKLGINLDEPNSEGQTAAVKLADEEEQPEIAAFLSQQVQATGTNGTSSTPAADIQNGVISSVSNPPPLPNGMDISIGTMSEAEEGEAPDPEIRRRIEELAARQDFHDESGQRELRELVTQVVSGISQDERNVASRRRVE